MEGGGEAENDGRKKEQTIIKIIYTCNEHEGKNWRNTVKGQEMEGNQ